MKACPYFLSSDKHLFNIGNGAYQMENVKQYITYVYYVT